MPLRLAALLFALLAAVSGAARAAELGAVGCVANGPTAICSIELVGEVGPEDRLYISRVHDRDTLSFHGRELGHTGTFLGRPFHAGFFPRVYPLGALKGERSPALTLEASGGLMHSPGIPPGSKVKVVDGNYPLWKVLGPSLLQLFSFGLLLNLTFFLLRWLRLRSNDGWLYPREELRWFLGSLSAYLLLRHEVSEVFVPLLWPATGHLFAQRIAVSVCLWSLSLLLLSARFSDRSCIERGRGRGQNRPFARLANLALLLSLALHASFPTMSERDATSLLALPLLPLLYAFGRAIQEMEWQRVLKRSGRSPLTFHVSLIAMPLGALVAQTLAVSGGNGDQRILELFGWGAFLCCCLRMRSFMQGRERSRVMADDCRAILLQHAHGSARLQALCDFVEAEWGAARVSVISVDEEDGLVLASSGPEAIPAEQRCDSRRLGPFLRRVCKQGQMLYAPVAEELGKDLQNQGLKHSSLAIPLTQEQRVSAVVCMMADEGERIPPSDAGQLELLVDTLTLEILSAVSQHVAENKTAHLITIARRADALAVEHLDHWGHFHQSKDSETRVVLGGDSIPSGPFFEQLKKSPVFARLWQSYRTEVRALWTAIASAYEFIPKDNREDFWVISPRVFRNPLLQQLGPERVALLLAASLERHARSLIAKECYLALGYCGARLVSSRVNLRHSSWHGSAVEIDSDEFTLLLDLRSRALPGSILFHGDPLVLAQDSQGQFTCRARPWAGIEGKQIFSILSAAADKKEVRRLESQALEKARGLARKAA